MGLAADLGYTYRRPNAVQRAMQAFGATRGGAWFFARTLRHFDRAVHALTAGRKSTPEVLAGLPVLLVTTTGRRSGVPRTSPLIAPPIRDTVALVGTNFGQTATPNWVHNLEADPHATVEYHNTRCAVQARLATEEEEVEIWERSASIYGGYRKYQERITGRVVRVFVLEPADA
jgi:deazaflavin-dependent oxidoreductase (nitroreductase family)